MRKRTLLLLLLLTGCTRNNDGITPQIILQEPSAGAITRAGKVTVQGYAFDDAGVSSIQVNGTELLGLKQYQGKKGHRIVPFVFQTDGSTSVASYTIQVTDANQNHTKLELPIRVDQKAPEIVVKRVDRDQTTMRIEGVVKDNVKVQDVLIDGATLGITPAAEVPFYAELAPKNVRISAVDSAGNKKTVNVEAPPPPPVRQDTENNTQNNIQNNNGQ